MLRYLHGRCSRAIPVASCDQTTGAVVMASDTAKWVSLALVKDCWGLD